MQRTGQERGFDYLIQYMEVEGRNATELAFEHSRRTIVVDPKVREAWKKGFDEREAECERLGAVHGFGLAQAQSIECWVEPRVAEDMTASDATPPTLSAVGHWSTTARPLPGKMALAPRETIYASSICASRL